jgi:hypothetical protein
LRLATALLLMLLARGARAEDAPLVVRQLAGVSISASDAGIGLGAQLGVRLSSLVLRLTFDLGPSTGPRGYVAGTIRGDWLYPINEDMALMAGIGIGGLVYGFIFDDPSANLTALTPGVGVLFGSDRSFGRVVAGLTGFVPLGPVSHERDRAGQAISPPHVMATLVLSL